MDKQEKIVCAAVKIQYQCGKVSEGLCVEYEDIFHKKLRAIHDDEDCCYIESEILGFITSKKRFVDAKEAYKIAIEAKQIQNKASLLIDIDYRIIKAKNSKHYYSTTTIKELEEERERIANKDDVLKTSNLY